MITKYSTYMEEKKITIDLEKGDDILTGRFKNKKRIVKKFGVDKNNQPTVNDKPMLNFRIKKLMNEDLHSSILEDKFNSIINNLDVKYKKITKLLAITNQFIGEYKITFQKNFKALLYIKRKYYTIIAKNAELNDEIELEIESENFDKEFERLILLSYFIHCVSFFSSNTIMNYNINILDTIDDAFDKVYNKNKEVIINLVKNNLLPDDLQEEYSYLLDANNFDLI